MTKPKTAEVKLAGDPVSSFYNFGTAEKPDWKAGGDIVTVAIDVAERLVRNKQATTSDADLQKIANQHPSGPQVSGGVKFDQDQQSESEDKN